MWQVSSFSQIYRRGQHEIEVSLKLQKRSDQTAWHMSYLLAHTTRPKRISKLRQKGKLHKRTKPTYSGSTGRVHELTWSKPRGKAGKYLKIFPFVRNLRNPPLWRHGEKQFRQTTAAVAFGVYWGGSFKEIELSRLRYSWLVFSLTSEGYRGLGVHDRPVYTAG